uniref:Uncharacterized protein n=1 Tax=Arundo donax TaxID=35708 RepID=A0A0A9D1M6_ARUDO
MRARGEAMTLDSTASAAHGDNFLLVNYLVFFTRLCVERDPSTWVTDEWPRDRVRPT